MDRNAHDPVHCAFDGTDHVLRGEDKEDKGAA